MVEGVCLSYIGGFDIRDNALDLQLKLLRSFVRLAQGLSRHGPRAARVDRRIRLKPIVRQSRGYLDFPHFYYSKNLTSLSSPASFSYRPRKTHSCCNLSISIDVIHD